MCAKFLSDDKILPAIFDLIDNAEGYVDIVSPYFEKWPHLVSHFEKSKAEEGIRILIRNDQAKKLEGAIKDLGKIGLSVFGIENLHAKIYLSEKSCILGSMNLYNFSATNNYETAILIDDLAIYDEITKYNEYLFKKATLLTPTVVGNIKKLFSRTAKPEAPKVEPRLRRQEMPNNKPVKTAPNLKGYCIRCGCVIEKNIEKPYCLPCFDIWKTYRNRNYKETHCHSCGQPCASTINNPICSSCNK